MTRILQYPARHGGDAVAADYRLDLLGGFALTHQSDRIALPFSLQRLLAFLALHPHDLVRPYVAGSLWPDSPQTRADASLRSTLWRLNGPAAALVRCTSTHIALSDAIAVDVHDVVRRVRRLMDPTADCDSADLSSTGLVEELLPDWTADEWLFAERERLRQLCLHGLEALAMRLLDLGRCGEAVEAGLAAVRAEPLRESAHRMLISIHLTEGNASEALRQYDWYRRLLRSELGLQPSPHVTRLVRQVRQVR